jgi:serine/threonine protein kinase
MSDKQKTDDLATTKIPKPAASIADTEPLQSDRQFQDLLAKLPEPAKMVGPYELVRKLGKGGMGDVWLARHTTNRKLVALKLLHKGKFDNIQRYLLVRREIEAQANLAHPHIVKILDVGLPELHQGMSQDQIVERLTAEPMYIALEYIEEARTLRELIDGDRLQYERIAESIAALAEALAYAHDQGVYHLDVKPANVLVDRTGNLLLADFGLGSLAESDPDTASGGTPLYMSPERLLQRKHNLAVGDIWALGVVFYELITGERPFPKTADITDEQFDYRPIPEFDAETPELFVDLCNGCLERDHATRCPSAEHVASELQKWLDNQSARPRRRALTIGIAALLILMMLGIGSGVAWLNRRFGRVTEQVADVKEDAEQESQKTSAEIQKLYEDPDVLTGKLKSHIRKVADKQIAEVRKDSANWRKIDEIEKRRDQQLDQVEQLVTTIRDGLAGDANPVFADAARILAEKGVDEALAFLKKKQPAIKRRVKATKARREKARQEFHASLEPWLMEAELHETNLAWSKSLERYEQVCPRHPSGLTPEGN